MSMYETVLKELEGEFLSVKEEWPKLRSSIRSKVVEWKWATDSMGVFEPFFFELTHSKVGDWLPVLPDDGGDYTKVGLDANGQILIELSSGTDTYYLYSEHEIISLEANTQGQLATIRKLFLVNKQPQWYAMYSENGRQQYSLYHYVGELISKIDTKHIYSSHTQEPTYFINYGNSGMVESIYRKDADSPQFPQGQNVCVYQHNRYTIEELKTVLIATVVDAVVSAIKSNSFSEPVWCLVLILFAPFGRDDWFPPALAIGLESEKTHLFSSLDEKLMLENSSTVFRLEGARLNELSQLFIQECETNEYFDLPNKVLKQIAIQLRQQNLNIPQTSDFLIIPYYTDSSLSENLEGVYTQDEIATLL